MFLSSQQITQSRDHTLNNLLELSLAGVEASRRWSALLSGMSRDAMDFSSQTFTRLGQAHSHGQPESIAHFPTPFWQESSARRSRLLDHAFEIFGEAHKAVLQSTEAQVQIVDEAIFAYIRRAAKSTPREAEVALNLMRDTLVSAKESLHAANAAAIESVESLHVAEQEALQIAESLSTNKSPKRRTTPKNESGTESSTENGTN